MATEYFVFDIFHNMDTKYNIIICFVLFKF